MAVEGERAAIIRALRRAGGSIAATVNATAGGNAATRLRDRLVNEYPTMTVKRLTDNLLRGLERDGLIRRDLGARGTFLIELTDAGRTERIVKPRPPRPLPQIGDTIVLGFKPLTPGFYVALFEGRVHACTRAFLYEHPRAEIIDGPMGRDEALARRKAAAQEP